MSEQSGRYNRSAGGMVGALVVLVVLVVGWVGFRAFLDPQPATPTQRVDYAAEVPAARKAAKFPLVAPDRLPSGWRATSAGFTDGPQQHWHLGVLTAQGRYVGLEQGDQGVSDAVAQYVDEAAVRGRPVRVAGSTWSTWTDPGGDLALVRRRGGATTLVVGHDVPRAGLVSYAASLR